MGDKGGRKRRSHSTFGEKLVDRVGNKAECEEGETEENMVGDRVGQWRAADKIPKWDRRYKVLEGTSGVRLSGCGGSAKLASMAITFLKLPPP